MLGYFASVNPDAGAYFDYFHRFRTQHANEKIAPLVDSSALNNLPSVTFLTASGKELSAGDRCRNAAVYLGPVYAAEEEVYRQRCRSECGNASRLFLIETDDQEVYVRGRRLGKGAWCIQTPHECNLRTGYLALGADSSICQTKFPNLFGGDTASTIVACNNLALPATGSVLWDYRENRAVDPQNVDITHEDEPVTEGSKEFRFRCKFGRDALGNEYVPHPLNRFHPIIDPCNRTVARAHRSVKLRWLNEEKKEWVCDCGAYNETLVKHADSADPQSMCTACAYKTDTIENAAIRRIEAPGECFNLGSPWRDILKKPPCFEWAKFTQGGDDEKKDPMELMPRDGFCELYPLALQEHDDNPDTRLRIPLHIISDEGKSSKLEYDIVKEDLPLHLSKKAKVTADVAKEEEAAAP